MQNMEARCRKAYVCVNLDVDKEGAIRPRFIRWDNGLIFQIDQILYKCRATSKKGFCPARQQFSLWGTQGKSCLPRPASRLPVRASPGQAAARTAASPSGSGLLAAGNGDMADTAAAGYPLSCTQRWNVTSFAGNGV